MFKVNEWVTHPNWGVGIITSYRGELPMVRFASVQTYILINDPKELTRVGDNA